MDLGYPLTVLVSLLGMAGAYRLGARTRTVKTDARCPCGHTINFHENLTGGCHDTTKVGTTYVASLGERPVMGPCPCQQYAGPELISSLTMRPIISLDGEK
jgi:hypothetical protein